MTSETHMTPETILEFWFKQAPELAVPSPESTHLWFQDNVADDDQIKVLFAQPLADAVAEKYDDWAETPQGRLALIILLQCLSKAIYRGLAKAYEGDEKALSLCYDGIANKMDMELTAIERVFFYLPLEFSEDLHAQGLSEEKCRKLFEVVLPETQGVFAVFLRSAEEHRKIIEYFGRFPTRNAMLGRENTPEEEKYLKQFDDQPKDDQTNE